MNNISSLLLPAAQQVVIYGRKLLQDITPEQFSKKPIQDGSVTLINHPAFQYGHLSLYPERIAKLFELPTETVKSPENFSDLFKKGSPCHFDQEGKIYPSMQIVTDTFFRTHEAIFELLKTVPDEKYFRINIEEASKDRFPTVGSFVIYLLTAHANTHFGQVCAWRRCVGLQGV
jgi:hypothetical protein